MEILLVTPISHTHYVIPPIGLGYLATAARKNGFNDIAICDCLKEKHNWESFAKVIKDTQPKLVGFQVFSYDAASANQSLALVKQINPHLGHTQKLPIPQDGLVRRLAQGR